VLCIRRIHGNSLAAYPTATEYCPEERIIFCYASIFRDWNDEWGYTSIEELESYKGAYGLGIERDLYWEEKPFSEVVRENLT
jgi:hypothetical protein